MSISVNDLRMETLRKHQLPDKKWICRGRESGGIALHQTSAEPDDTRHPGMDWVRMYGVWDTPEEAIDGFAAYRAGWDMGGQHMSGPIPNPFKFANPLHDQWIAGYSDRKAS